MESTTQISINSSTAFNDGQNGTTAAVQVLTAGSSNWSEAVKLALIVGLGVLVPILLIGLLACAFVLVRLRRRRRRQDTSSNSSNSSSDILRHEVSIISSATPTAAETRDNNINTRLRAIDRQTKKLSTLTVVNDCLTASKELCSPSPSQDSSFDGGKTEDPKRSLKPGLEDEHDFGCARDVNEDFGFEKQCRAEEDGRWSFERAEEERKSLKNARRAELYSKTKNKPRVRFESETCTVLYRPNEDCNTLSSHLRLVHTGCCHIAM